MSHKSKAIQFLERKDYLQIVIDDVKDRQGEDQEICILEWLNDLDNEYELGSDNEALMEHVRSVQNYIKTFC